ncbi:hypothetical protein [Sphingomonas sp. SUN039]|uniref:hypothetical protein n=1 Tax=Sphingomonas sp. SUN039 TaxID=2937787 RepID=UPI002164C2FA|nr:hypothetical protein [Sphingomonas sp. SUN039]UVO53013.1 hypothetical protein M0209_02350 [Sphingomonas sp. SUN039]
MSGLTNVSLSLATYKAIEAQRLSFGESHDAIIRRALATRSGQRARTAGRAALLARGAPRKRGRVRVTLFGREQDVFNLRDAYLVILTALTRHKASLLQLLANEGSTRRRWVAPSAEALFVTAPHLAHEHAHEIAPQWFVDTNVSRAQIVARLTVAARLAGYSYGEDMRVIEG